MKFLRAKKVREAVIVTTDTRTLFLLGKHYPMQMGAVYVESTEPDFPTVTIPATEGYGELKLFSGAFGLLQSCR